MAQAEVIAFNVGAFIAALVLLELGGDAFITHATVVAGRIGVSEVIIGLLTAGAEWEELAVVVASLAKDRPSLAIGNIIGSAISNILGAFSLGLLCYPKGVRVEFDRSSRIYSLLLLALTTVVSPLVYFSTRLTWLICGPLLIATFAVYFLFVTAAVGRGILTAPEDSDDSDSDDDDEDIGNRVSRSTDPLLNDNVDAEARHIDTRRHLHRLAYHGMLLFFGFLAICLAGYVLSQAAINITDELGISDLLFGVIILAIATTLPEKFIAVMSGYRGHPGILVANCAGSNIFLLSLCCGIIMVHAKGSLSDGNVTASELGVLWLSTAAFTATIWFGERHGRWIGGVMITGYIIFIVLEFTVIHAVTA